MRKLNIRWRLTLWNTLSFAALLLVFSIAVYGLQRHALYEQTDRLLASQFDELRKDRRLHSKTRQRFDHWVHEFKEHVEVSSVIYDRAGNVVTRTEELASDSVPPAPADAPRYALFETQTIPILGPQRVMSGQLRVGDSEFTVLLMTSLEEVHEELGHVLTVLLMAVPLTLVLAGTIGYGLARKALAPIDQLRLSTDQITADSLNQRLDIVNPTDELGRLTTTLNRMIERLERSFVEMKRFTADAAHELRTPLAVIRNEAEVTLRAPRSPDEHRQVLENVLLQTERLTQMTDQLLFLCRQDTGLQPATHTTVWLDELLSELVHDLQIVAADKGVTLVSEKVPRAAVVGDLVQLRRLFVNLLDNAIKYTPAGGCVSVRCQGSEDRIAIVVSDTGIGIPEGHLRHIFERFYRVDSSRTGATGGIGLGLSICQTIAEAHGGRIDVESAIGKGTEFVVSLPTMSESS